MTGAQTHSHRGADERTSMRTGVWLTVLALGGIFAFAVTADTPVFSFHIAGYVVMAIAILGLVIPRRGLDWLGQRRLLIRRFRGVPGGPVMETSSPRYVLQNPAGGNVSADEPSLTPDPRVAAQAKSPAMRAAEQRSGGKQEDEQAPPDSEVVEEVYEE